MRVLVLTWYFVTDVGSGGTEGVFNVVNGLFGEGFAAAFLGVWLLQVCVVGVM
jgi:hypothetical protein